MVRQLASNDMIANKRDIVVLHERSPSSEITYLAHSGDTAAANHYEQRIILNNTKQVALLIVRGCRDADWNVSARIRSISSD